METLKKQQLEDFISDQALDNPATLEDLCLLQKIHSSTKTGAASEVLPLLRRQAALVVFLSKPSAESAVQTFCSAVGMDPLSAENAIKKSIEEMPTEWREERKEEFYRKGLIYGLDGVHVARPLHELGGKFDELRSNLTGDRQHILSAAIDCFYKVKNKYGWRGQERAIHYVAIQLQDDGDDKIALLQNEKQKGESASHQNALYSSYTGIEKISAVLGVNMNSLPSLLKGRMPSFAKPKAAALQKPQDWNVPSEAQKQGRDVDLEILQERLSKLSAKEVISARASEVFLFAATIGYTGKLQQRIRIQSRFTRQVGPNAGISEKLPLSELDDIMSDVSTELAKSYSADDMTRFIAFKM